MNYYIDVWKKFAKFDGRARRKEYWMFFLFNVIAYAVLYTLAMVVSPYLMYVALAYMIAVLVPSIAVGVRRMHDIGKSGAYLLVSFIPVVGGIWLLVLTVTPGVSGSNAYGSDPKA